MTIVSNDLIKVEKWTDNKDGSATMKYTITPYGESVFRSIAKRAKKELSEDFINDEIYKAIKQACKRATKKD